MNIQHDLEKNIQLFLAKIFDKLKKAKVDISRWPIDHICYRTSSSENYSEIKEKFSPLGKLLIESEINGRPIATYKLNRPIVFDNNIIDVIEVPSPKAGIITPEGLEHIEVVIDISFDELIALYPNIKFETKARSKPINPDIEINFGDCAIKFHHQTLEAVIAYEISLTH
jgi:predicted metalloenzyme YecM